MVFEDVVRDFTYASKLEHFRNMFSSRYELIVFLENERGFYLPCSQPDSVFCCAAASVITEVGYQIRMLNAKFKGQVE